MKKFLLTCLIFLTILPVFGQSARQDSALRVGLMGIEYHSKAKRYSNNQYFNQWTKGTLYLKNGEVIPQVFLRYDKYVDDVLWLRETDFKAAVFAHDDVVKFELSPVNLEKPSEFVARRIKLPYHSDSIYVFLQVLVKGPVEMCAYRKVKEASNNFALQDDTYYILFTEGKSYFTGLSKRNLANQPFIDKVRMKAVLKSNKIRLNRTEESVVKFIQAYNSYRP